jgi:hypothetical protein
MYCSTQLYTPRACIDSTVEEAYSCSSLLPGPGPDSSVWWPPSRFAMCRSINTHSSTPGMAGIKLCFLKSDKWCLGKESETSAPWSTLQREGYAVCKWRTVQMQITRGLQLQQDALSTTNEAQTFASFPSMFAILCTKWWAKTGRKWGNSWRTWSRIGDEGSDDTLLGNECLCIFVGFQKLS